MTWREAYTLAENVYPRESLWTRLRIAFWPERFLRAWGLWRHPEAYNPDGFKR